MDTPSSDRGLTVDSLKTVNLLGEKITVIQVTIRQGTEITKYYVRVIGLPSGGKIARWYKKVVVDGRNTITDPYTVHVAPRGMVTGCNCKDQLYRGKTRPCKHMAATYQMVCRTVIQ